MKYTSVKISNLSKEYYLKNSSSVIKPLVNFSLSINEGEVVGIIGKNGSGKSTLLKIMSGLIKPTTGTVELFGSVSSILDIGSNFHPDLNGYENTRMFLLSNKVPRDKISIFIKAIQDFSGIGDFFYQPVKTYSNGMYLRLAFSTVFNALSDILLIDEVLAVGDESFKMKCFDFIKELKSKGKTIVLASHSKQEILELCTRCIWLENGKIKMDGYPMSILPDYYEEQKKIFDTQKHISNVDLKENVTGIIDLVWGLETAPGNSDISIRHFSVKSENTNALYTSMPMIIKIGIEKKNADIGINIGMIFYDQFHQAVFFISSLNSSTSNHLDGFLNHNGQIEISCSIPPNLLNAGTYYIALRFGKSPFKNNEIDEIFRFNQEFRIKVNYPLERVTFFAKELNFPLLPFLDWREKLIK